MIFKTLMNGLAHTDFAAQNIDVYKMEFPDGDEIDYYNKGRKKHLLHYITSGVREYLCEYEITVVPAGSVIFIPDQTEYKTTALPHENEHCSGIGICFDSDHELEIDKKIYFSKSDRTTLLAFYEIEKTYNEIPINYFKLREAVYHIFSMLSAVDHAHDDMLTPAITFIQEHYKENHLVSEYARQCAMSESYFRKRFKENMGISPLEYRNQLRLAEAKRLYQMGKTILAISEEVGFEDPSYLSKLYKKHNAISLKDEAKIY